MKTLILVHHRQAVNRSPMISDHDRGLTSNELKQSRKLAKLLPKIDIEPDHVISSNTKSLP